MSEIIINFGSKIFKFSLNPNMAGFVKVVFWGRGGINLTHPFIFQEGLIQYQYNITQLLNNLSKVG